MLNLSEFRNKPANLADFLPWAALVAEGIVLNKDGAFQRTARFRGPDLQSATDAELVSVTARLNNALRRLGSGLGDLHRGKPSFGGGLSGKHVSRSGIQAGRQGTGGIGSNGSGDIFIAFSTTNHVGVNDQITNIACWPPRP
jgi:hypothetical protein